MSAFRSMIHDVQVRLPFYVSDWTVGFRPSNFPRCVGAHSRCSGLIVKLRALGHQDVRRQSVSSQYVCRPMPVLACNRLTPPGLALTRSVAYTLDMAHRTEGSA